ncbi:hypothetical protein Hanom_Chr05g00439261 [Helianthus anomalus]
MVGFGWCGVGVTVVNDGGDGRGRCLFMCVNGRGRILGGCTSSSDVGLLLFFPVQFCRVDPEA